MLFLTGTFDCFCLFLFSPLTPFVLGIAASSISQFSLSWVQAIFRLSLYPKALAHHIIKLLRKYPERGNLNWLEIKVMLYHYIQGNENENCSDFSDTMQVRRQWKWVTVQPCPRKIIILEFHLQRNNPSKLETFPDTRAEGDNRGFLLKLFIFVLL